jgi:transposase
LDVVCIGGRHACAFLSVAQINKYDRNHAKALAQLLRTGLCPAVHVDYWSAHQLRAVLGARTQLVAMTTRISNHVRGVMNTFSLEHGAFNRTCNLRP